MMTFSKHNILTPIAGSDKFILLNLLRGNADILTAEKAREIREEQYTDVDEYTAKGYLVDPEQDERLFRQRYLDFLDERDSDEIQVFFVPWYACNFGCSYCYQEGYSNEHQLPTRELVDRFFRYVHETFAGRRKYLTLFGGEPLLDGPAYRDVVQYFLEKAHHAGLETAIVTNGYLLSDYVEMLSRHRIREIQVTLDGLARVHDLRRPLKGGGVTFDRIVHGIDQALALDIAINLRVVIDRENISELPALAAFAIQRGWTSHPKFKTQLGRNYELHTCQTDRSKLLSRVEMFQEIYGLVQQHPEILQFHKPAFSIAKFLFENGELPSPLYDSCPGTKTEWAFDYTGRIYSCTATVGKAAEALGTFYPTVQKNEELIARWEERDVTTITGCAECNLRLACGGGCASVAFNTMGDLHGTDCRPINELVSMGISTYFKEEL